MNTGPEVRLLDYSINSERNTALAARLCYSPGGLEGVEGELSDGEIRRLNKKLADLGHHSVFEHSYFYFWIRGSRVLSHQLVRQRIGASYSQRSQRYVSEDDFHFITPPSIGRNENAAALYREHMKRSKRAYRQLLELGVPREDARFALAQGTRTEIVVSYNARSLLHFFRLRCCQRAQWEIRMVARRMLELVREVTPTLFSGAGPLCETEGRCEEGELGCGRIDRLRGGQVEDEND